MDLNEKLIEEIRKYECIYNLSSPDYKNVFKKTQIWEEVAKIVNLPEENCRKRWKGLRDTYKKRKRAQRLASGSGAPIPCKTWKYMNTLSFFYGYSDSRETIGNVPFDAIMEEIECSTSASIRTSPPPEGYYTTPNASKQRKRKAARDDVNDVFTDMMKECVDTVKEHEDATSLLFKSLARNISEANLTPQRVGQIEAKIVAFHSLYTN
nr:uncharacterized protein LOC118680984 [Bactrocera oleae]